MIYAILAAGAAVFIVATPALIVGRCTELIVRHLKKPPR